MERWVCGPCGWVYDPAVGDPDGDIPPGVAFEDLPEDYVCQYVVQPRIYLKRIVLKDQPRLVFYFLNY